MSELNNDSPARTINSSDATTGQPMVLRVLSRKAELEGRLLTLRDDDLQARQEIDNALATIGELLTGDLEHIPPVVVAAMSRWLERNKHVAESAVSPAQFQDFAAEATAAEAPAAE